jgi:hypothetical protein
MMCPQKKKVNDAFFLNRMINTFSGFFRVCEKELFPRPSVIEVFTNPGLMVVPVTPESLRWLRNPLRKMSKAPFAVPSI